MNDDQTKNPIDLRNIPTAITSSKPGGDTKVPADDKPKDKVKDKAKPGTTGVLRDLRDN